MITTDSLKGRTALVTGAARRIGREISLAFADAGVNIVAALLPIGGPGGGFTTKPLECYVLIFNNNP